MNIVYIISAALLGLVMGSFANVLILRRGTGRSALVGRSMCMSCGKVLRWFHLVPVLSFLGLRGRCNDCGSSISWQYPLVEAATGLLFAGWTYKVLQSVSTSHAQLYFSLIMGLVVIYICVLIAVYDILHKIIPDEYVYLLDVIGLVSIAFNFYVGHSIFTAGMFLIAGPLIALPFYLLWYVSSGRWIGFGDIKLFLAMGWLLGPVYGVTAVAIAFWVGALYVLLLLLSVGTFKLASTLRIINTYIKPLNHEIPFGPFLVFGLVFTLFWPLDVFNLAIILNILMYGM